MASSTARSRRCGRIRPRTRLRRSDRQRLSELPTEAREAVTTAPPREPVTASRSAWRRRYGQGVRVIRERPAIRTTMPIRAPGAGAQVVPARRAGEPEEVAEAIVWLLSPAGSYVACANIRVAGGKP